MNTMKFRPKAALFAAALLSAVLLPPPAALAQAPSAEPEPVTDLVATQGTRDDRVRLDWTVPAFTSTFSVYRCLDEEGATEVETLVESAPCDTVWNDMTAEPGVHYRYWIVTTDVLGRETQSNTAIGWRVKWNLPAPVFARFEVSQGTYPGKVVLSWSESSDSTGLGEYYVMRQRAGTEWIMLPPEQLAGVPEPYTATSFEDTTAEPGVKYQYWVGTDNEENHWVETERLYGWAGDIAEAPSAPVVLSASTNRTDGILVTWKAGSGEVGGATDAYRLYRIYEEQTVLVESDLTETEYLDTDAVLFDGLPYKYEVEAVNSHGCTRSGNAAAGWVVLHAPPVVDGFTASRGEYPDRVWLYWTPADEDVTCIHSWRILRFDDGDDVMGYVVLTNSTMVEPGFLDTTVTPDVRYRYQLLITDIWGRETLAGTAWGWAFSVPDNDNFADARPISSKSGTDAATNNCASFEVSEPYPAGVPSATRTVWWSYAAPFDGMVRFDTDGSHYLLHYGEEDEWPEIDILGALGVYTGDAVTKLDAIGDPIPCVDSEGETYYDQGGKIFESVAGTVYRVQASGYGQYNYDETLQRWDDQWGLIRLNWIYTHYRVTLDPNGGTISTNAVMVPAGQKLGDALADFPVPVREGYRFVDWKFENNASVSASAAFAITESHALTAEWAWITPNDDFEDALRLNAPGQINGFSEMPNTNATLQAGEPLLAVYPDATHTLWWSWIAAEDCTVRLSTTNSVDSHGSQIDTVLGVYTGSELGSLEQVATGDDGVDDSGFIDDIGTFWSFAEFEAKKGTVYWICVGVNDKYSRQVVEGTIRLNWGLVKDGVSSGGYALLPPGSSGVDIPSALGPSADPSLEDIIGGDVDAYNDFAEWANEMGADDVRASAHAAASYQLGTTELLQNEPEISIERSVVVPNQGNATTGGDAAATRPRDSGAPVTLTLVVTVRDGGDPVEVTAAKVAALVEATRDVRDWDSPETKLDPHAGAITVGSDTTVTITATPGDGSEPQAFLRIAL